MGITGHDFRNLKVEVEFVQGLIKNQKRTILTLSSDTVLLKKHSDAPFGTQITLASN